MSKSRRIVPATICAGFVFCQIQLACAGTTNSAAPSSYHQPSVAGAQVLAQNAAAPSLASTVAEAAVPNPQSSTPAASPVAGATVAAVTPPTPASLQNKTSQPAASPVAGATVAVVTAPTSASLQNKTSQPAASPVAGATVAAVTPPTLASPQNKTSQPAASPAAGATVAAVTPPTPASPQNKTSQPAASPVAGATVAVVTPPKPVSVQNQPATANSVAPAQPASTPAATSLATPAPTAEQKQPGLAVFDRAGESERRDPNNWVVHIYKAHHKLDVYFQGHLYKSYHAVFGRSRWMGAKQWEGDLRTPEGNYLIVAKHPSRRFDWFLRINYPNAIDEARFDELHADQEIPPGARAGGSIGIHGSDNPLLNVGDINWTTGCISVVNSDIEELARLLPTGTLVIIEP
jgi:hypothetical protein